MVVNENTGDNSPCSSIGEFVDDKVAEVERREITEQSAINTTSSHARIIGRRCDGARPDGSCGFNAQGFLPTVQVEIQSK